MHMELIAEQKFKNVLADKNEEKLQNTYYTFFHDL